MIIVKADARPTTSWKRKRPHLAQPAKAPLARPGSQIAARPRLSENTESAGNPLGSPSEKSERPWTSMEGHCENSQVPGKSMEGHCENSQVPGKSMEGHCENSQVPGKSMEGHSENSEVCGLKRYPCMAFTELAQSFSRERFCRNLQRLVPEVRPEHLAPGGAGVRAQAMPPQGDLVQDFQSVSRDHALNILNAPAPPRRLPRPSAGTSRG